MRRFSERLGLAQPKAVLQTSSMDDDLRNSLWNVLSLQFWRYVHDRFMSGSADRVVIATWVNFHKRPVDTMPAASANAIVAIRKEFFEWPWNTVYDYIEFVANVDIDWQERDGYVSACNVVLARELAGYRFVGYELLPIGTEDELAAVEQARRDSNPYAPVREHLKQAASLLADRKNPDLRNSIKESISAVEAACGIVTNAKGTLGDCLKAMGKGGKLHPALGGAFEKLYGWTSDAEGIRHALQDEPNLDIDDARFMLVACSAFVSYLLAKAGT